MSSDVAALFSFPHFELLGLPPARMHLVGLAIALSPPVLDIEHLNAKKFANAAKVLQQSLPVGLQGVPGSLTFPLWPNRVLSSALVPPVLSKGKEGARPFWQH